MLHEIYDDFFMHDGIFLFEIKLLKDIVFLISSKKNRKIRFLSGKKVVFTFFLFVILKSNIDTKNDYKNRQRILDFEVDICFTK